MFLVSCSDETTVYQDTFAEDVSVENDEAVLQQSISFTNAGALDIFNDNLVNRSVSKSSFDEPAGDYPLTQIAQIKPPVFR